MDDLTTEQKLEVGRMLREGVSDDGINAVVQSWVNAGARYATYVEYGKPWIKVTKTVEGSITPVIDETHQLTEGQP
jgi:hypothetical protein